MDANAKTLLDLSYEVRRRAQKHEKGLTDDTVAKALYELSEAYETVANNILYPPPAR